MHFPKQVPTLLRAIRSSRGKVYAFDAAAADAAAAPWTPAGRPGMQQKAVRGDRERGTFLGLLGFDPLTRTGLHQHQAPALSYFLDGGLFDYDGLTTQGQVGINLKGATHDAIAYNRCMLASCLEGPVTYRPADGADGRVHTGAAAAPIVSRGRSWKSRASMARGCWPGPKTPWNGGTARPDLYGF